MAIGAPRGRSSGRAGLRRSSAQSPAAAVTQVWMRSLAPEYSLPLRRSRTVPVDERDVQVWQMPIRQPKGMLDAGLLAGLEQRSWRRRPRRSCWSRRRSRCRPRRRRRRARAVKRSRCSWSSRPALSQCSSSASSMGAGPQAQVSRSRQSGQTSSRSRISSMPSVSVCCSCSVRPSCVARQRDAARRGRSCRPRSGAECTITTSGMVSRRSSVRSIAITGVMPLPAVRKSILAGGGSGSTKSPWGRRAG